MSKPRYMPDGSLQYPRKGKDPPLAIRGYRRKNDNPTSPDAWIFIPEFPPCMNRQIQLYPRGCGTTGVHLVCGKTQAICKYEDWNPCKNIT